MFSILLFTIFLFSSPSWGEWECGEDTWVCEEVLAAGQVEDEVDRYNRLVHMRSRLENGTDMAMEMDNLIWVADHWANGRDKFWDTEDDQITGEDGYLGGWFMFRTIPWGLVWPLEPRTQSPAHPLWALYRGKMLIWNGVENGFRKEDFFNEGLRLLSEAREVFVNNSVVSLYFGDAWLDPLVEAQEYPAGWEWVAGQRRALVGMEAVIRFWCEERLAGDGQLGGGWGDDVEVWRDWVPVLLGFKEPHLVKCWERVAAGALARPSMAGGYTDRMTDVEHSAEETGDTLTSLLLLDPGNSTWREWAGERLVNLANNVWTGINHHGRRQFVSTYFTSASVSGVPEFGCDTAYHSRTLQPALLAWQLGDYRPGGIVLEWLDTYLAATRAEERGKPAGVVPSAIAWPSGTVGGWPTHPWNNPGCHYSMNTYAWPRAVDNVLEADLLAFYMTGQEIFLEPILAAAKLKREWLRSQHSEDLKEGVQLWVGKHLKVNVVLSKYRDITGDDQFDDLILATGDSYQKFVISGEVGSLASDVERRANLLANNMEVMTTEVRFSDRIFKLKDSYINEKFNNTISTSSSFQLLHSMVSGAVGGVGYFPRPYIRWRSSVGELSALVRRMEGELELRLWIHKDGEVMDVKFELLNVVVVDEEVEANCNGVEEKRKMSDDGDGGYSINLPTQVPCVITILAHSLRET